MAGLLRVGAVQFKTFKDRKRTLTAARDLIGNAAASGAKLVALPECWTGQYGISHFPTHAEDYLAPDSGSLLMKTAAAEHGIHVVGGVIEQCSESDRLYNTVHPNLVYLCIIYRKPLLLEVMEVAFYWFDYFLMCTR